MNVPALRDALAMAELELLRALEGLEARDKEVARLEEEVARLYEALTRYGEHAPGCRFTEGCVCVCGLYGALVRGALQCPR